MSLTNDSNRIWLAPGDKRMCVATCYKNSGSIALPPVDKQLKHFGLKNGTEDPSHFPTSTRNKTERTISYSLSQISLFTPMLTVCYSTQERLLRLHLHVQSGASWCKMAHFGKKCSSALVRLLIQPGRLF